MWLTFPEPNLGWGKGILPSLQHLFFKRLIADGGDWEPLKAFLSHRASSGNRLDSLTIIRSSYMRPDVIEGIRSIVLEFRIDKMDPS